MSENLSEYTPPEGYVRTTVGELRRVSQLPHPDMLVPVGKMVIGPLSDDAAAWVPSLCAERWGVEVVDESSADPLFDPEAEGWEKLNELDRWRRGDWFYVADSSEDEMYRHALIIFRRGLPHVAYHGAHPTRSLVMAIIEQNGGD